MIGARGLLEAVPWVRSYKSFFCHSTASAKYQRETPAFPPNTHFYTVAADSSQAGHSRFGFLPREPSDYKRVFSTNKYATYFVTEQNNESEGYAQSKLPKL